MSGCKMTMWFVVGHPTISWNMATKRWHFWPQWGLSAADTAGHQTGNCLWDWWRPVWWQGRKYCCGLQEKRRYRAGGVCNHCNHLLIYTEYWLHKLQRKLNKEKESLWASLKVQLQNEGKERTKGRETSSRGRNAAEGTAKEKFQSQSLIFGHVLSVSDARPAITKRRSTYGGGQHWGTSTERRWSLQF